jgi:hypothetical protein
MQPNESGSNRTQTATRIATAGHVVADPDLVGVVDVWPTLPAAIKAGILAMVKAAAGSKA